jgi:predicted regulator of Ras-like GTPase activity (Roadblock/LC7/MglB family)
MDDQLLALLEYDGVLTALAATPDGLVVGAAGLKGDDAEIVAAAGSTLLTSVYEAGASSGSLDVGSASVHLLRNHEVSLVVLAEAFAPHEALVPLMRETLDAVTSVFA